ncbi:YpoC family protein [Bacillus wiedmannii]|uniref:YpoC family protein n=1 Tax=Bacillus wiedmannii TaxID=1890302 RepID=UPI000BF33360|nr:GTPase [Bacillus wiedmannii]MEE3948330.1 GTPase [Bacillus wiedmannii]PFZ94254.1 GTPase [Bacillus wiedmannii]HDR7674818.1 GTPase [Bacillus wiedmannii]
MERVIEIPKEFRCVPFFKESANSITYHTDQSFEEIIQNTYFIHDIERQYEPWNEIKNSIPVLLNVWKSRHEDIATLFRNRNKQEAESPMILFAAHLLSIIYWLNEQPVHSLNEMEAYTSKLEVQPVNFMERYSFIIKKLNNYHSYIQLAQLYIEIEKLYVKKMITKKKSFSR